MNTRKLKAKIVESGYSMGDIADKMNISRQSLYNKVHGKTIFRPDEITLLCDILRITNPQEIIDIFLPRIITNL